MKKIIIAGALVAILAVGGVVAVSANDKEQLPTNEQDIVKPAADPGMVG